MRSDNHSGNAWVYKYRGGYRVYFRVAGRLNGTHVFSSRAAADEEAERIRAEITMRSRSIGSAVDAYRADMVVRELAAGTIARVENDALRMLGDVLNEPLSSLTARRAESLYTKLATSGDYKAGTHQMSLKVCKAFGGWCAHPRRRWLRENPFAAVERVGKVADHRSESLRVNEARAFRKKAFTLAAGGDLGAVAALLALLTSLRPSEIVQITARDVDDGGMILWIAGTRVKTANTRRPMEIADLELRALLVRLAKRKAPSDRLIPHFCDFPYKATLRIAEELGLPKTNPRILRRTFASLAARRGRSLDDLAFSMGHGADANAATAQRHYIAPGAKQTGAAGRVLGVLDGGKARRGKR
jgi:integrase